MNDPVEPEDINHVLYVNGEPVGSHVVVAPPKPARPRRPPELDPNIFVGPKLKLERAKRHIEELETAISAFFATNPYELVHEQHPKTGENIYRVRIYKSIPPEIATIIGDVVHNLRSSLDQLVCDLIRANKRQIRRGSGFPISGTAKHFESNAIGKIEGISPIAERLVRRLKPYKGGNTPLWILNELDALDKHQGIIPIAAAHVATRAQWFMPAMFIGPDGSLCIGGGPPGSTPIGTGFGTPVGSRTIHPLKDKAEIYRSAPAGVQEEVEAAIEIAFGQTQITQGEPVVKTLKQIAEFIQRVIVIFETRAL